MDIGVGDTVLFSKYGPTGSEGGWERGFDFVCRVIFMRNWCDQA